MDCFYRFCSILFKFFRKRNYNIFNLIAGLCSVAGFLYIAFGSLSQDELAQISLIYICLLSLVFLLDSFYHRIKCSVFERRGNYLKGIKYIMEELSDKTSFYKPEIIQKNSERIDKLRNICATLSQGFQKISGYDYDVCIKVITQKFSEKDNVSPLVTTLCRSSNSRTYNTSKDHYISKNTDFDSIFLNIMKPDGVYFFDNKLPFLSNYQNTSFEIYSENFTYKGIPNETKKKQRLKIWPLPYRSTIVVPIVGASEKPEEINNQNLENKKLRGFLCIDSKNMNIFDEENDVSILKSAANMIYRIVDDYYRNYKNETIS
jgi:hypothetical protein